MFRRRKGERAVEDDGASPEAAATDDAAATVSPQGPRARGPWDASEVTLEEGDESRIDLGGLVVTGRPGVELRMQVDEGTRQVKALMLVGADGAVELRPFAAPRHGSIWEDVRRAVSGQVASQGGSATEAEGEFGTELRVAMPVTTPEGKAANQLSRVVGIEGPRWLLQVTLLGKAAVAPDPEGPVEAALRDVVVVRGSTPMAPGEPLPLTVPANARPVQRQADT